MSHERLDQGVRGREVWELAEQRVDAADTIDARLLVDLDSCMIALDKPPATIEWE